MAGGGDIDLAAEGTGSDVLAVGDFDVLWKLITGVRRAWKAFNVDESSSSCKREPK